MPSMRPFSHALRPGAGRLFPDGLPSDALQQSLDAACRSILEHLGLTHAHYLVLALLWERDGATPVHLAQRLKADRSTVEGWLTEMVLLDLIEVDLDADPSDIWLSPRGRALRYDAPVVSSTVLVQAFRWSSPDSTAPDGVETDPGNKAFPDE